MPSASGPFLHTLSARSRSDSNRTDEKGFALAGTSVLVLVIVAILSSFAFVARRNNSFKAHYAAGQRVAAIAVMAHRFAQQAHYDHNQSISGAILYDSGAPSSPMTLPDNAAFAPIDGIHYEIIVHGWEASPVNSTTATDHKAASAYIHVRIRPDAGRVYRPADRAAFLAGASKHGASRVGIVGSNIPAGDVCDTSADVVVRWGPEDSACLSGTHLGMISLATVHDGDMILPAWEPALAVSARHALFRFPQPERPDLNVMHQNVRMNGNAIHDVDRAMARNIHAGGDVQLNQMIVRNGHSTQFAGQVTFNNSSGGTDLVVTNSSGAEAMTVNGQTTFSSGASLNVADTIYFSPHYISLALDVSVSNPVTIDTLSPPAYNGVTGPRLQVQPMANGGQMTLAALNAVSNPANILMTAKPQSLVVMGELNTASTTVLRAPPTLPMHIYAASFTIKDPPVPPAIVAASHIPVMNVGSIDQRGNSSTNYLRVRTLEINDCHGQSCPNHQTQTPTPNL